MQDDVNQKMVSVMLVSVYVIETKFNVNNISKSYKLIED